MAKCAASIEAETTTDEAPTQEHVLQQKRRRKAQYMREYRAKHKQARLLANRNDERCSHEEDQDAVTSKNKMKKMNADRMRKQRQTQKKKTGKDMTMMEGQNFTSDPKLALIYYYCCGGQPDALVFNDEHVRDYEHVRERLLDALDSPLGKSEYERCQTSATSLDPSQSGIFACASCCEFLVGPRSNHVCLSLSQLSQSFRISDEEYESRYGHLSDDIAKSHAQVFYHPDGKKYFLNPELVRDTERIHLCASCAYNPRKSKFSLANGHDYGRYGSLPDLSPIAKNCIAPARCFGLEFSISGKHCSGHSICFPSSGPQACTKVLPVMDIDRKPRVTFIGPTEEWRARKHLFWGLYELPSESIFSWLNVLKETHSFFRKECIVIDDSLSAKQRLADLQDSIEKGVIVSDAGALHAVDDAVNSERFGTDITTGESPEVVIQQSTVLQPAMCHGDKVGSVVIDAMINAVGEQDDIAVVRRGVDPIVEWDENGYMIAGAFPTFFMMGGDMLPSGSFSQGLIDHLMRYYDGRFENNVTLIVTLFNQLQRYAAVRKAARASTTHAKTLQKLGQLASGVEFRKSLLAAKNNPDSPAAKLLNASLLRILSVIGGTIPFSPFERAETRPKLAAMRFRFGLPQFWVTVAPPEQDDITLHRIMLLRQLNAWNDEECTYGQSQCRWAQLPKNLKESPRLRLSISNKCPALAAFMFERKMELIQKAILRCPASQDTKKCRNYTERSLVLLGL
ncbi:hypothetical protein L915_18714 [Phytophthora nicotianae]|uniref:Uncharacterized protein n=3 Tax=Phytophthora nicotianae TaxID=4792 RepID=W2FWW2_PHYNI|nr:hypothetical protein L915_18714 [Phytophthora nicotianae]